LAPVPKEPHPKDFYIRTIPMIEIQGGTYVRTVVYYDRGDHYLFGSDASAKWEEEGRNILNEDFTAVLPCVFRGRVVGQVCNLPSSH
jgi:hypothetical protein